MSGEGWGVVVHTGIKTVEGGIGKVQGMRGKSGIKKEMRRFLKSIGILALITAFLFFFWALARGRNFAYAATFGIGMIIAWIPQGLAFTVTIILGVSGRRMSKAQVLVKDFHGIETLGSITMLATDKTGTLTKNEMKVVEVYLNEVDWEVEESRDPKSKARTLKMDVSGLAHLMHICVTCSKARLATTLGDPTEKGLLKFASERLKNVAVLDNLHPKLLDIPFTSDTKIYLTIHRKPHPRGGLTLHIKGAPEIVWALCDTIWKDGKITPITTQNHINFQAAVQRNAGKGYRLIAVALLHLDGSKYPDNYTFDIQKLNYPVTGYTFLGLVALHDPPKPNVDKTILTMKQAGIQVVMITGDNHITAQAISRQVNLLTVDPLLISTTADLPISRAGLNTAIVVAGGVIDSFSPLDWVHCFTHTEVIFARVLPSHKLAIVKNAQGLGHIVAVTGDGTNLT